MVLQILFANDYAEYAVYTVKEDEAFADNSGPSKNFLKDEQWRNPHGENLTAMTTVLLGVEWEDHRAKRLREGTEGSKKEGLEEPPLSVTHLS
ncbi:hypothetical protein NQZ68_034379 [Dissostichus eleginoides]|nr:hypothetical protein NQZ68_034379 [Dissostichus eleginoides]